MSNALYPTAVRGTTWPYMMTPEDATIVQSAPSFSEVRVSQVWNPRWHLTLIYDYIKDNPADLVGSLSPYTDYQTLNGFWLARHGQYDDFLVDLSKFPFNSEFYSVTNQALSLVNDGAGNYYTPIQRNFGGQFLEDITDLNPLNGSGLTATIKGASTTLTATGFVISGPGLTIPGYSFLGMYIAWAWQQSHTYAANSTIIDPSGHLQKVTAGGGGNSGGSTPTWNDFGGTTTDGALTWTDQGVANTVMGTFNFYFRMRFETDSQDFELFMNQLWTIGGSSSKNGSGMLKMMTSRPVTP